ncbi:tyrosine-type recombinase/integrase [Thermodesulfobacteriota bacterium]
MRVITATHSDADDYLIQAFRVALTEQDLSSATIKAYLHDLKVFREWFVWVHEGKSIPLVQVETIDLAAFRKHLVQKKALRPATVNRRVQSLRLFFGWLKSNGHSASNPAESLSYMRSSRRQRPLSLKRSEVRSLLMAATTSPHLHSAPFYALLRSILEKCNPGCDFPVVCLCHECFLRS